ncbi:MAG: response regulator [Deltaproteobacteria bacterium]|nr:response regulator [Deltaproteobacteria bacterium]
MSNSQYDELPRILVVDDEEAIREILADFLSLEGFYISTAKDGKDALEELSRSHYDIVLSDLKMPNMGGIELLETISHQSPRVVTVIMTGFGTVETAIDAMKRGAYDYIMKPFKMEEVVHVVQRGLEKRKLEVENLRLKEAVSLYEVSEAIAANLSRDEVLKTVTDAAIREIGADLVVVILRDQDGRYAERARSASSEFTNSAIGGVLSTDALDEFFKDDDIFLMREESGLRFFEIVPNGPPLRSLMVTKLGVAQRTLGYIAVCSFVAGKVFDEGQRKMMSIVSHRAAASIENARLYEDLKLTFSQTIEGFVNAIDKMDRYTAGHSEGVATYAQLLASRLELSQEEVEVVRQSALMHDIGKIGCSLNLNKRGRLSHAEYQVFKQHPKYGKEILDPIKFLAPIIPGVYLHHERWDGKGYPCGYRGEAIPLIARIISLADAYDAMTSQRAYRRPLTHKMASQEILDNAGSQFDPNLAKRFIEVLDEYRKRCISRNRSVPE